MEILNERVGKAYFQKLTIRRTSNIQKTEKNIRH